VLLGRAFAAHPSPAHVRAEICSKARLLDWQDELGSAAFARLVAASLGEYVTGALDAIDAGEWAYDPAFGDWRAAGRRTGTPAP